MYFYQEPKKSRSFDIYVNSNNFAKLIYTHQSINQTINKAPRGKQWVLRDQEKEKAIA
jgi:hypothetical protein